MVNWWNGSVVKDIAISTVNQYYSTHFSTLVILWLFIRTNANTYYCSWFEMKTYWNTLLKPLFSKGFFLSRFYYVHILELRNTDNGQGLLHSSLPFYSTYKNFLTNEMKVLHNAGEKTSKWYETFLICNTWPKLQ